MINVPEESCDTDPADVSIDADWHPRPKALFTVDGDETADCAWVWQRYTREILEREKLERGVMPPVINGVPISERMSAVLDAARKHFALNGRGPTLLQIAQALELDGTSDGAGIASAGLAVDELKSLGLVTHTRGAGVIVKETSEPDHASSSSVSPSRPADGSIEPDPRPLAAVAEFSHVETAAGGSIGANDGVARPREYVRGLGGLARRVEHREERAEMTKVKGEDGLTEIQRKVLAAYPAHPSPTHIAGFLSIPVGTAKSSIHALRAAGLLGQSDVTPDGRGRGPRELTAVQSRVRDEWTAYVNNHGAEPRLSELTAACGMSSDGHCATTLKRLRARGDIAAEGRYPKTSRFDAPVMRAASSVESRPTVSVTIPYPMPIAPECVAYRSDDPILLALQKRRDETVRLHSVNLANIDAAIAAMKGERA